MDYTVTLEFLEKWPTVDITCCFLSNTRDAYQWTDGQAELTWIVVNSKMEYL